MLLLCHFFVIQICEVLHADGLVYQDVDDLLAVGYSLNPNIKTFDAACFDGHYVTGVHSSVFDCGRFRNAITSVSGVHSWQQLRVLWASGGPLFLRTHCFSTLPAVAALAVA